jgi:ABC-type Fe3+/spermidine/putrescine transport system ATPase subunit
MIAGFQDVTSGAIYIRQRRVDALPPEKRNTGMVFQNYALFPHMSLEENVGFGLRMRRLPRSEIRDRVAKALAMVRMSDFAERRPTQLSGGQQQRVALARALVIKPDALLLDEPLGALDRQLREQMQLEIKSLQRSVGITTVFVTHDQDEALTMSERIVVINAGRIEQIGTPQEIYGAPDTKFVAEFIGKSNSFGGVVIGNGRSASAIDTAVGRLTLHGFDSLAAGAAVDCVLRPEKVRIAVGPQGPGVARAPARVTEVAYRGSVTELHVLVNGKIPMMVLDPNSREKMSEFHSTGDIEVEWAAADILIFHKGNRCRRQE